MDNQIRCNRCVMDTSATEITFLNGVCNFCREWERQEVKRKAYAIHPSNVWIYEELRKNGEGKKYDCLLGLSGGVDSATCLHILIENGIRPLCFTVDNGWNTPKADENIMRMIETLKVPFYRYTIDLKEFAKLQEAFIRSGVKNIEIPTDHILMATTYEMAVKNGLKYIISGGNHSTEGIMPESYGYQARDLRHVISIAKMFNRKRPKLPLISIKKQLYYRFIKGIQIINLLDLYEYNKENYKNILKEKYGWQDYGMKHGESLFTAWFQNWYLPQKFGIDKRKPHLSSMIMSGQITRQQALEELAKPLERPDLMTEQAEELIRMIPKQEYTKYKTSEKYWNLLSKIYAAIHSRK